MEAYIQHKGQEYVFPVHHKSFLRQSLMKWTIISYEQWVFIPSVRVFLAEFKSTQLLPLFYPLKFGPMPYFHIIPQNQETFVLMEEIR
jgi:hypothetical protein